MIAHDHLMPLPPIV